jgi:hypothetical protein
MFNVQCSMFNFPVDTGQKQLSGYGPVEAAGRGDAIIHETDWSGMD